MRYEEIGSNYSNIVQWGYDDKNNLSSQTQTLNGYPVVRRREHRHLECPPLRMGRAGHHAHAPCVEAHPGGG